jgi:hypothetical protein
MVLPSSIAENYASPAELTEPDGDQHDTYNENAKQTFVHVLPVPLKTRENSP